MKRTSYEEVKRIHRGAKAREEAIKQAHGPLDWKYGSPVKRNDMVEKLNAISCGDARKAKELSSLLKLSRARTQLWDASKQNQWESGITNPHWPLQNEWEGEGNKQGEKDKREWEEMRRALRQQIAGGK
jgi:hypothetical protein